MFARPSPGREQSNLPCIEPQWFHNTIDNVQIIYEGEILSAFHELIDTINYCYD